MSIQRNFCNTPNGTDLFSVLGAICEQGEESEFEVAQTSPQRWNSLVESAFIAKLLLFLCLPLVGWRRLPPMIFGTISNSRTSLARKGQPPVPANLANHSRPGGLIVGSVNFQRPTSNAAWNFYAIISFLGRHSILRVSLVQKNSNEAYLFYSNRCADKPHNQPSRGLTVRT